MKHLALLYIPSADGLVSANASQTGNVVNLKELQPWILWVLAIAGFGFLACVLLWMMPPPLRRGKGGYSIALGAVVFFGWAGISRNHEGALWFGAIGFLSSAFPLLWMGKLPPDMPSSRDPDVFQHPQYQRVARRGRIAGIAIIVLAIAAIGLSLQFVAGLT